MLTPNLKKLTKKLCNKLHFGSLISSVRITGGKNNQIYLLTDDQNQQVIFKHYYHNHNDTRDRLGAEWRFINTVWDAGIRCVPQPLLAEPLYHCAVYGIVKGRKLHHDELTSDHIKQAAEFISSINKKGVITANYPAASEACFSIAQHYETIARRVTYLQNIDTTVPLADEAKRFVFDKLYPKWLIIKKILKKQEKSMGATNIGIGFLSPSDYGFHNTLINVEGRLVFLDFEYSGRDDLAKLVNDWMACPEIPVPPYGRAVMTDHLCLRLPMDDQFQLRSSILAKAYQIKWICIILNDFLTTGAVRRDFSLGEERMARNKMQLEKAKLKLATLDDNN